MNHETRKGAQRGFVHFVAFRPFRVSKAAFNALLPSILDRAFRGELGAPP